MLCTGRTLITWRN